MSEQGVQQGVDPRSINAQANALRTETADEDLNQNELPGQPRRRMVMDLSTSAPPPRIPSGMQALAPFPQPSFLQQQGASLGGLTFGNEADRGGMAAASLSPSISMPLPGQRHAMPPPPMCNTIAAPSMGSTGPEGASQPSSSISQKDNKYASTKLRGGTDVINQVSVQ